MPEQKDCGCVNVDSFDSFDGRCDSTACRFPALQEENARLKEALGRQACACTELTQEYKERAEKAEARVAELERAITRAKAVVKDATPTP